MTRLVGHGLRQEGAAFDDNGKVQTGIFSINRSGSGRAKCECGEMSEVLPSGAARRRWHRDHKTEVSGQ